jgi:hypothetical protein
LFGRKINKLRQKKVEIDAALTDSSARFVLVTAYSELLQKRHKM